MQLSPHVLLIGLTALTASCATAPPTYTADVVRSEPVAGTAGPAQASCCAGADLPRAQIELPGGTAPLNRHFSFHVHLETPSDRLALVDADMPAHGHGMLTRPAFEAVDGGCYRVDGMLFHMPGDWVIFLDVVRDGESTRLEIPLNVDFAVTP